MGCVCSTPSLFDVLTHRAQSCVTEMAGSAPISLLAVDKFVVLLEAC